MAQVPRRTVIAYVQLLVAGDMQREWTIVHIYHGPQWQCSNVAVSLVLCLLSSIQFVWLERQFNSTDFTHFCYVLQSEHMCFELINMYKLRLSDILYIYGLQMCSLYYTLFIRIVFIVIWHWRLTAETAFLFFIVKCPCNSYSVTTSL